MDARTVPKFKQEKADSPLGHQGTKTGLSAKNKSNGHFEMWSLSFLDSHVATCYHDCVPIMLPDFPSVKHKFLLAALKFTAERARDDALLSQIREHRHFEGNRMDSYTIRDETAQRSYTPVSIPISIPAEELIARGPEAFMERMFTVAEELKKQKAKLLFERLTEVTNRTGNVVDAAGKGMDFDLFLQAFEKVQTDFDSSGNPIFQTLVCSPVMFKQLAPKIKEWNSDPECKRRFDELVERKRKEWHDRESNRKLVD